MYSIEPPQTDGSNEYPQSMFLSRNKKNNVYPCKPQFYHIKVGFKGSKLYRHVFVMGTKRRRWEINKANKNVTSKATDAQTKKKLKQKNRLETAVEKLLRGARRLGRVVLAL